MISLDLMKSPEVRIAGDQPNCVRQGGLEHAGTGTYSI